QDLRPQPSLMQQSLENIRRRELRKRFAWLAEPVPPEPHIADAELAPGEIVQPDAARGDVPAHIGGMIRCTVLPVELLDVFSLDKSYLIIIGMFAAGTAGGDGKISIPLQSQSRHGPDG